MNKSDRVWLRTALALAAIPFVAVTAVEVSSIFRTAQRVSELRGLSSDEVRVKNAFDFLSLPSGQRNLLAPIFLQANKTLKKNADCSEVSDGSQQACERVKIALGID